VHLAATSCTLLRERGALDIRNLPVESIITSNVNPRKEFDDKHLDELSESLREDGQWNPIIVRQVARGFELIAGECRLRAAKILDWKEIRCNVVSIEDREAHVLALKTNLLRKNLNIIEESEAVAEMLEKFKLTQDKVAELLGKKQSWVSRRLSLASKLCPQVKSLLKDGKITACHALALLNLGENEQIDICKKIVEENLSVRVAQDLARGLVEPGGEKSQVFHDSKKIIKQRLKHTTREIEHIFHAPIEMDEYDTSDGFVCIIRCNMNRRKLRRRDMLESLFNSFDEAQNWARNRGGCCSGLITRQGKKYWMCFVDHNQGRALKAY
jgi:ParB family chromosome partitioning protein